MTDFLETTVDKFTFKVATDRSYTSEGVWVIDESGSLRIGLSDFVQQRSGDVAFAEVKPAGTTLAVGDEVAVIETIKVNITYNSPVNGKISEVNPLMSDAPEAINQDPYGAGWLYEVRGDPDPNCLDVHAYQRVLDKTIDRILEKQKAEDKP